VGPLVFLHGFAQRPSAWRAVRARLPAGAQLECPLPGHDGEAPLGADWDETIARVAARVPAGATAIGYSLGARVALGLLARDAIDGAILISVNPGLAGEDERAARRREDAVWAELLRARGTAAFLEAWEAQPIFATAQRADPAARAARRAERATLDPIGLAGALEVLGLGAMPDLTGALLARADRAHLIAGDDDAKFCAIARRLAAGGVPATILDGSGHDPTLERPAALAAVIAGVLA
jgi:2-succinyl-6-hydroxy-2,4-cyclohexadiene-1-carboxylate synthase